MKLNKKSLLITFMILQVVLDNKLLYSESIINSIGFSPTTIIRFLFVGIIFLFVFFDKKSKHRLSIFIYGLVFLIYTLLHHFVCVGIDESLIYSTFIYNIFDEIQYVLVMLMPILIIYIAYEMKITKKDLYTIVKYSTFIISIIMVFSNLFLIAFKSYGDGLIRSNLLTWFFTGTDKLYLASKGFFNSANQISGLIVLLFPLQYYYFFKYNKKFDFINCLLIILSSFMLGTRVSAIGIFVLSIFLPFVYLIYFKMSRKTFNKNIYIFIILLIMFSTFSYAKAPIVNCFVNNFSCIINNTSTEENNDRLIKRSDYDSVCDYLAATSTNKAYYKNLYPCKSNLEFWENFSKEPSNIGSDNRIMEKLITNDVYSKIVNNKVKMFGMSRSRFLSAELYLERDVVVHQYTIGILGIILFILPYVFICILTFYKMVKQKIINPYIISLIASIMLTISVAYLTGHIIDELITSMFMGLFAGSMLNYNGEKDE